MRRTRGRFCPLSSSFADRRSGSPSSVMTLETGDFTPVHVRGRKFKRKEKKEEMKTPSTNKRDAQLPPPAATQSKRRKTKQQQQKVLSRLESLPAELIEHIFLECLEFNLPRASPYLSVLLSREGLYRALILYALWNDPGPDDAVEDSPSARAVSRILRPIRYTPISARDRYSLQTAIWSCRWCTLDRVKRYLRDFAMLSLNRWRCGRDEHADGLRIKSSDLDMIAEGLGKHTVRFRTPERFVDGYEAVQWSIGPEEFSLVMRSAPRILHGRDSHGEAKSRPIVVVSIPDKLIVGNPWTAEKVAFLALLRGWASYVCWQKDDGGGVLWEPFSREKLQSGIHAAIVEHNPLALRWLLEMGSSYTMSRHFPDDIASSCQELGERQLLPQHYLTAVRRSEDPTIFKLLIRADPRTIPRDDPEVTAWAMRIEERGDRFGRYLLDVMAWLPPAEDEARVSIWDFGLPDGGPDHPANFVDYGFYFQAFEDHRRSWIDELQPQISEEKG